MRGPVLIAAAAGLAALGTVAAQQPAGPPPSAPVRPAGEWAPAPKQPAGGAAYFPPPPGYNPNVNTGPGGQPKPRLTNPVVAGPTGVRPAGGFDLPPPNMDLPAPSGRPASPPGLPPELPSKFPAMPVDPKPPVPAVPPPSGLPPLPGPTGLPVVPPSGGPAPLPTLPTQPAPDAAALPPPNITLIPGGPATPPALPSGPVTPPAAAPTPVAGPAAPAVTALPTRAAPSVLVEAVCPETVGYGQEFVYKLVVKNTGTAAVGGVRVEDEVPPGCRYVGSDPPAEVAGDRLAWAVGVLDPGAERPITVRVKPGDEGEVRSRATVSFAATVDARTRVTRPKLAVAVAAAEQCRAGEEAVVQIKLTNAGTGPAARLVLQARLSDGLYHPQAQAGAGSIEAELPPLAAGESRTVPLRLTATKAGPQWCQVAVTADGSPDAGAKAAVSVVEPLLAVRQAGPVKCLVRAEPTYAVELTNPGTAATDPILVQTVLPDGFEFVGASDGGAAAGKTVTWRLPGLQPNANRALTFKLRAVAAADSGLIRTVARTESGAVVPAGGGATAARGGRVLEQKAETAVTAEGVAAVRFEVVGLDNPAEVGKDVTYEIRVTNQGTGPCGNVRVGAVLAEGTEFVGATAGAGGQQAAAKAAGQQLTFDPIPSLGVKAETVYRVKVRGTVPGDLRFRVHLTCDGLSAPLVKEESTRFYRE